MTRANNSSEEVRSALMEVLTSPQVCSAINDALASRSASASTSTSSSSYENNVTHTNRMTPATTRQALINSRIHEMFPSIRPRESRDSTSLRRNVRSTLRYNRTGGGSWFEREVFLLQSKDCEETLKRSAKFESFKDGFAKPAVKFHTKWGIDDINGKLKETFEQKLNNSDFDLLIPKSGYLCNCSEAELNGLEFKRLTQQKSIYMRPYSDLIEQLGSYSHNDSFISTEASVELTVNNTNEVEEINECLLDQSEINECLLDQSNIHTEGNDDFLIHSNDDQMRDVISSDIDDHIFSTVLSKLYEKVDVLGSNVTYFNAYRENIFFTCKLALQRRNFNPFNRISVNFVDVEDKTEGAIDGGGLTAEMFRLCLAYFQTSGLFEGNKNSMNLTYDIQQLNEKNYFYCGQIMGMSILHGYGGPNFFSETFFNVLTFGIEAMAPQMDDLPEGKLKFLLKELSDSNDLENIQNSILEEDMISIAGWSFITSLDQKEKLINDILKFHLYHRLRPALDQFENGLRTCEIHHLLHKFPTDMKKLFCFLPNSLTFPKMKDLFTLKLSELGSNLRRIENVVLTNYYNFLVDCEANDCDVALQDILVFTTGCSDLPPLGFKTVPSIEFLHGCSKIYPEASTCGLILRLPVVHTEYQQFKDAMSFGIKNAIGFGFE